MLMHVMTHDVIEVREGTYVLNERTLVIEGVTLAQVVELVVKMFVDLAGGAVLDEQTTEDTQAAHPHDLAVHHHQLATRIHQMPSRNLAPHSISL